LGMTEVGPEIEEGGRGGFPFRFPTYDELSGAFQAHEAEVIRKDDLPELKKISERYLNLCESYLSKDRARAKLTTIINYYVGRGVEKGDKMYEVVEYVDDRLRLLDLNDAFLSLYDNLSPEAVGQLKLYAGRCFGEEGGMERMERLWNGDKYGNLGGGELVVGLSSAGHTKLVRCLLDARKPQEIEVAKVEIMDELGLGPTDSGDKVRMATALKLLMVTGRRAMYDAYLPKKGGKDKDVMRDMAGTKLAEVMNFPMFLVKKRGIGRDVATYCDIKFMDWFSFKSDEGKFGENPMPRGRELFVWKLPKKINFGDSLDASSYKEWVGELEKAISTYFALEKWVGEPTLDNFGNVWRSFGHLYANLKKDDNGVAYGLRDSVAVNLALLAAAGFLFMQPKHLKRHEFAELWRQKVFKTPFAGNLSIDPGNTYGEQQLRELVEKELGITQGEVSMSKYMAMSPDVAKAAAGLFGLKV